MPDTPQDVLESIAHRDPDNIAERKPNAYDYANFKRRVIERFGEQAWVDYHSNWGVTGNEV